MLMKHRWTGSSRTGHNFAALAAASAPRLVIAITKIASLQHIARAWFLGAAWSSDIGFVDGVPEFLVIMRRAWARQNDNLRGA